MTTIRRKEQFKELCRDLGVDSTAIFPLEYINPSTVEHDIVKIARSVCGDRSDNGASCEQCETAVLGIVNRLMILGWRHG
jgi:hypothetical protein